MNVDASHFLASLTCNKSYIKKKKYLKRKRKTVLEREQRINNRPHDGKKKSKKARKDASDVKKKVRKPKTTVSGMKTGKETLLKDKARALVKMAKSKKEKVAPSIQEMALKHASEKPSSTDAKKRAKVKKPEPPSIAANNDLTHDIRTKSTFPTLSSSIHSEGFDSALQDVRAFNISLYNDELDRVLIEQMIRGKDYITGDESIAETRNFVREDPALYPPEVAFYEDLAEEKEGEDITENSLLDNAHRYFKELNAKEHHIKQSAAAYLKRMRKINRRGGDKDGFRYVLPSSVKQVARQMMLTNSVAASGGKNSAIPLAMVGTTALNSTFDGDGVRAAEAKPMRSRRLRMSTFSDFYKFQVSKRWTQNAESFLNRGRAHKALFNAKKRQRSIRKL
ncbi:unnamed protein product [Phytomonas sp. EM1]|nr:unnamed protein product [Phytomonas sp. EM1]|eukprot:CCW62092.1 unnamed protein product [Phytomonas sp. isolate EM1]